MQEQISFIPFEEQDIKGIKKYFANKTMMKLNGLVFRYLSENQLYNLLQNVNEHKYPPLLIKTSRQQCEDAGLIIFEKQKPMATGVCCRILCWEEEKYESIYFQVVKELIEYVFNDLNLVRISIYVPYQEESLIERLLLLGFEKEFIGREGYYSEGAFRDIIRIGLLRKEKVHV